MKASELLERKSAMAGEIDHRELFQTAIKMEVRKLDGRILRTLSSLTPETRFYACAWGPDYGSAH